MKEQLRYTSPALPGAIRFSKPIRTVLLWQFAVTAIISVVAALLVGVHGAISAAAGGLVSIVAGMASALVASLGKARSAGGVLVGALRAEAVKIGLALVLLWLVLTNYEEVVVTAFLGAFIVTMLIFSMAFFVRDY
ncbi:MAG TPA: ATP synthase subunit I [Burkholderiales bacterium]